jgi:hypothetical protein
MISGIDSYDEICRNSLKIFMTKNVITSVLENKYLKKMKCKLSLFHNFRRKTAADIDSESKLFRTFERYSLRTKAHRFQYSKKSAGVVRSDGHLPNFLVECVTFLKRTTRTTAK